MAEKKLQIVLELVDQASAQLKKVGSSFDGLSKKMNAASGASKAFAAGFAVVGAAVAAGAAASINLAREQIRVEKQLEAVIASTGGAAGVTAEEVKEMAAGLQKMSNFGDEAIISGQNMLLTFTQIGKDVLPQASQAMVDMSAAMGTDLQTNSILLGKALNDPIAGISALGRVGVKLTEDQKDLITSLVEVGDTAGAQTVILDELATQFGGSAQAQIDPIIQLQNVIGDVGEEIGMLLLDKINPLVEGVLAWIDQMGGLQGIMEAANTWIQEHQALLYILAGAIMGALVPALIAAAAAAWAFVAPLLPFIAIGALIGATIWMLYEAWKSLMELLPFVTAAWEFMKARVLEQMITLRDGIVTFWDAVKTKFDESLAALQEVWFTVWQFMQDHLMGVMSVLLSIATGGMSNIIGWFIENRGMIVSTIGGVWDAVKDKAVNAFNGIKSILRSTMNFILAKVNKFIGGLNTALSIIPGNSFSIPPLPAFADGGIVTKPTVGLIGEAGTEAIIPLNKANKFGFGGGGGTTININWSGAVDERAGEMVAREIARVLDLEGRTSISMGNA